MRTYYTGTHHPNWLWTPGPADPLCVSRHSLTRQKTYGRARVPWILDSGGFTVLSKGGELPARWEITPHEYAAETARYMREIGNLQWAAPMDMMCEPDVIARTGRDVDWHQAWTVENGMILRQIWPQHSDDPCPFRFMLQGWTPGSYVRCWERYEDAGVDLAAEPVVGVGSICRRDDPRVIAAILGLLHGLRLHGWGVKATVLKVFAGQLESADSLAWSFDARYNPPLPGHETRHQHCNNCRDYAADWRGRLPLGAAA
jgi:hypothetical protein